MASASMKRKARANPRRERRVPRVQPQRAGATVRVYERWTPDLVIARILELHRQGGPLAHSQAPPRLVGAAIAQFGSWRRAIEAAGLDYTSVRLPTNTRKLGQQILAMLRKRAESGRTGIGPRGLITSSQADKVRRRFKSVRAAVQEAGLDADALGFPSRTRYDSDDAIARELRSLMREQPNMRFAELSWRHVGLAAKRRFGTLQAGLSALGIEGWPRQRNALPLREEIVMAIQDRRRRGDPMDVGSAMANERRLVKAAYKRFGTWRAAMRAAGLGAEIKVIEWDRARVRAELNGRRLRGEPVGEREIQQDDPELWRGIVERYAGLADALRDGRRVQRKSALRNGAGNRRSGSRRTR